jgi:hypothetical protein
LFTMSKASSNLNTLLASLATLAVVTAAATVGKPLIKKALAHRKLKKLASAQDAKDSDSDPDGSVKGLYIYPGKEGLSSIRLEILSCYS